MDCDDLAVDHSFQRPDRHRASIVIGTKLSHFRVTAEVGQGGMGEVYRAEDTKLGREVAIKVLPEVFVAEPERLGRFEREAKVLASLNHPHIAQIYGIAAEGSNRGLLMELVEGPTRRPRWAVTTDGERFLVLSGPAADEDARTARSLLTLPSWASER